MDADGAAGALIERRRKITPTHHERMVWGQGDASGLCEVDSRVGRMLTATIVPPDTTAFRLLWPSRVGTEAANCPHSVPDPTRTTCEAT